MAGAKGPGHIGPPAALDAEFHSGIEVAFFTRCIAEAARPFRNRGETLGEIAERSLPLPPQIRPQASDARAAMAEVARALIVTADAIDRALEMPDDSDLAFLDLEKLQAAVDAFYAYANAEARMTRLGGELLDWLSMHFEAAGNA